jgi:hypothetical protein
MSSIGTMDLEEAAKQSVSNWLRFPSFVWYRARDIEDAEDFAIVYTHHRDSGLLDQSNAEAIRKALEPFTEGDDPDVFEERHNHWACGWIDGFAIRVFRNGEITEAFKVYHDLAERMDTYPVLSDEDYSRREYEATPTCSTGWRRSACLRRRLRSRGRSRRYTPAASTVPIRGKFCGPCSCT